MRIVERRPGISLSPHGGIGFKKGIKDGTTVHCLYSIRVAMVTRPHTRNDLASYNYAAVHQHSTLSMWRLDCNSCCGVNGSRLPLRTTRYYLNWRAHRLLSFLRVDTAGTPSGWRRQGLPWVHGLYERCALQFKFYLSIHTNAHRAYRPSCDIPMATYQRDQPRVCRYPAIQPF